MQTLIVILLLCISSVLMFASAYFVFRSPKMKEMNVVRVHKGWGTFVLIVGLFLAYGGVWSVFYGTNGHPPNTLKEGAIISAMGWVFICLMLPSFTRWHDVYWDDNFIEGPNKIFGPTLRFSRTKIVWQDVIEFGQTFTQYHFVKSKSGDKIYFSPYSVGLVRLKNKIWHCLSE